MNVLLAAASFSSELSGVQRHALNLARCLLAHSDVSLNLVVAPWQMDFVRTSGLYSDSRVKLHIAPIEPGALSRNRWYYRRLPALAAQCGADVVHLTYPVPVNARAFTCPIVVSLHDLYPYDMPSNFGVTKVLFNRLILQQCLRNVDSIACVSETTYLRLGQHVPRHVSQRALRIYNCVEPEPQCSTQSPFPDWQGEPFLLCVAQHRRNKNIPFLLRVFKRLLGSGKIDATMHLALIGIPGPETRRIQRIIDRDNLSGNVVLMKGLSEPDLQWCYKNCAVVLAPSKIEGFGLPVAEALLAGCRVVCSDIPAFREVGGEHCHYVSLEGRAEERFAQAIVRAMCERQRTPVPLPFLSSSVIAAQYMQLYRRLLSSASVTQSLPFPVPDRAPRSERQSSL